MIPNEYLFGYIYCSTTGRTLHKCTIQLDNIYNCIETYHSNFCRQIFMEQLAIDVRLVLFVSGRGIGGGL